MVPKNKVRLNLYLSKEVVDFAKNWSYVTDIPISKMVEDQLREQKELVARITPFQWFSDPDIHPPNSSEDESVREMQEYLNNREEEEFCLLNPDHPRAKIRRKVQREYEALYSKELEKRKKEEKEVIQRWIEVFSSK